MNYCRKIYRLNETIQKQWSNRQDWAIFHAVTVLVPVLGYNVIKYTVIIITSYTVPGVDLIFHFLNQEIAETEISRQMVTKTTVEEKKSIRMV